MTKLEIKSNEIYLNQELSTVGVYDFNLDIGLRTCKYRDLKKKTNPVLKKLFGETVISTDINIHTNMCIYHVRRVVLSILSISENIRVNIHYSIYNEEESFFKKIDHEDILRLRYMNLFESILKKMFRIDADLFYYILYSCCYNNLIISDIPSRVQYDMFMGHVLGLIDSKTLTNEYYNMCMDRVGDFDLFEINNSTIFILQKTIDKYGWLSGRFYDYFNSVRELIIKEMGIKINNHLHGFDPAIDRNFQSIIENTLKISHD
tara:strand:- start:6266 stop:7051 length:786 start_codon:yes stop_codon:yes gene_type:complete